MLASSANGSGDCHFRHLDALEGRVIILEGSVAALSQTRPTTNGGAQAGRGAGATPDPWWRFFGHAHGGGPAVGQGGGGNGQPRQHDLGSPRALDGKMLLPLQLLGPPLGAAGYRYEPLFNEQLTIQDGYNHPGSNVVCYGNQR